MGILDRLSNPQGSATGIPSTLASRRREERRLWPRSALILLLLVVLEGCDPVSCLFLAPRLVHEPGRFVLAHDVIVKEEEEGAIRARVERGLDRFWVKEPYFCCPRWWIGMENAAPSGDATIVFFSADGGGTWIPLVFKDRELLDCASVPITAIGFVDPPIETPEVP